MLRCGICLIWGAFVAEQLICLTVRHAVFA